ncbi:MAG: 16S rRNA (cytosine(1402)-N(4))-methyltransferase RsmH [Minisyncoccia bacterium]
MAHISVLLHESVENLDLKEGEIFLDGTLGAGGHSALVAKTLGEDVEIIGLDRDPEAIKRSEERLRTLTTNAYLRNESFRNLDQVLFSLGVSGVDAILFDLGISSDQLDAEGRGFSFQRDEPLDMSMSKDSKGFNAKVILNTFDEEALELILRGFGEEKFSRRIAKEIIQRRETKPFETTFELVEAVRAATPSVYHRGKLHPATRTFQALRIATNEELTALEEGLEKGFEHLNVGGRFVVISFHSLEDRIVKQFFKKVVDEERAKMITKKPIEPTLMEIKENPRSRSAKLRVIEKII